MKTRLIKLSIAAVAAIALLVLATTAVERALDRSPLVTLVVVVAVTIALIAVTAATWPALRRNLARFLDRLENGGLPRIIVTPTAKVHPGPIILDAIRAQARLETVDMLFANDQDESQRWGLEIFGSAVCQESITYYGYYTVTAGVDLESLTLADVHAFGVGGPSRTRVTITVPRARILHVEPMTRHNRIVHRDSSIGSRVFGSRLPEMVLAAQLRIEDYARNAALEKGILRMAQEQAGEEIRRLLLHAGYRSVTLRYADNAERLPPAWRTMSRASGVSSAVQSGAEEWQDSPLAVPSRTDAAITDPAFEKPALAAGPA